MLATQRLILRRFVPEDWKDLHEYLSDPEVVRYEPYEAFAQEASRQEAARRAQDEAFWAVCLKENGKLIGNIYLSDQGNHTWELGYVFNRSYQGKGYALESARAAVDHVIRDRGARRIIARCNPDNEKSWRLLERLGLNRERHLKHNAYFKTDSSGHPIWHDTYEYGISSLDWEAGRIKEQADRLLHEYGLLEELKKYGTPHVIGSYRMDMMAWNDLDIDVSNEAMSMERLYELTSALLRIFRPVWYEAKQETTEEGKAVWFHGFETMLLGKLWNVDIWFFDEETIHKAEAYCDEVSAKVRGNSEMRQSILDMKKRLIREGLYTDGKYTSMDVYKAVLEEHVLTYEAFLQRFPK